MTPVETVLERTAQDLHRGAYVYVVEPPGGVWPTATEDESVALRIAAQSANGKLLLGPGDSESSYVSTFQYEGDGVFGFVRSVEVLVQRVAQIDRKMKSRLLRG